MRLLTLLTAAVGVAVTVPAAAQQHLMQPARDVVVDYHMLGVAPGQQRSDTVRIYFSDHGMKMRIEPLGQPAYSIVDRTASRMTMVMTAQRMYMELPYDPRRVMAFDDTGATFARTGSDTVAGVGCTVYETQRQGHSGQVCISADGVLLRAKSDDPTQDHGGLVATSVTYGPQSPDLFAPPPDFQRMEMPNMPPRRSP